MEPTMKKMIVACLLACACSAQPTPREETATTSQALSQRGPVMHLEGGFFCADAPNLSVGATVVLNTCSSAAVWGLTNAGYTATHKIYPRDTPNLCIFPDVIGQPVTLQDCALSHSFTVGNNTLNDGYCIGTMAPGSGAPLAWGSCTTPGFFHNWTLEGFPAIILTGLTSGGQTELWTAVTLLSNYEVIDKRPQVSGAPYPNQIWELVTHGQGTDITAQQDNLTKWVYSNLDGTVRIGTLNPLSTTCTGQVGMMWQFFTAPSTNEPGVEGFGGCPTPGWAFNPGGATPVNDQTYSGNGISFEVSPVYCDPTAGGC
jgi:hypothetical protein